MFIVGAFFDAVAFCDVEAASVATAVFDVTTGVNSS